MQTRLAGALVALSCAAWVGCGSDRTVAVGPQTLTLRIALDGDVCGVVSAQARISGPDFATLGPVPLTVKQGAIEGTVGGIPVGENRTVEVSAFNSQAKRVYFGSTNVTIFAGQSSTANIALQRDPANCEQTGSVIIVGTINGGPSGADGGQVTTSGDAGTLITGPGLAFTFEELQLTSDGVLHFLDKTTDRIHRLDVDTAAMLPPLIGTLETETLAVSPDGTEAYVAYTGGRIDRFNPQTGAATFFAAAPETVSTMIVAGGYLFTIDGSGAWSSHSLYDRATGMRVATDDWRNTARSIVYSPVKGRVYFLDSYLSPTDVRMVQVTGGTLGAETDSPYHGDYVLPNPIRLLPDESGIIVGSGIIFDATSLTYRTSIGLPFVDIAFLGTELHLLEAAGANSQVRTLSSNYSILRASLFAGTPVALFARQSNLVLVTKSASGVTVRVFTP